MSWLVLGAGKSGISAARHLAKLNRKVLVSDPAISNADAAALKNSGIDVTRSPQNAELVRNESSIEGLVPSPGIHPDHPLIQAAKNRGIPFYTDIDLALERFNGDVIAVTGTNGKSTSVAMITHILNTATSHKAIACGNFGYPALTALHEQPSADVWVIELSSYQLEYSHPVNAKAVLLTSYSKDHLSWHKTEMNYFSAKWRLVTANTLSVPIYADNSFREAARRFGFSWPPGQPRQLPPFDQMNALIRRHAPRLFAVHDQQNGWIASKIIADLYHLELDTCAAALATFTTLAHRFEFVGTIKGVPAINDSKATNVDATCRSLASLTHPCTLLLGGLGKGESYASLLAYSDRVNRIVCFGADGPRIAAELEQHLPVIRHDTLKEVLSNFQHQWLDGPVLLSPGCASFDEFKNFEERGDYFRQWAISVSVE